MPRQLPNIFFIVLDTLGAKHMSLYGYPRRTTPNLERIAEECTVYTRCFAPACWTLPSHASMFTGLYPSQHGVHDGNYLLDDRVQHLASVLKMSGYRTMGISSNGLVSPASSLCRDFDHFVDFGASELEAFRHHFQEWLGQENGNGKLQSLLDKGMNTKEQISTLFKYLIQTGNFKDISHKALQAVKNRFNWFSPDSVVMHSSIYTKKTVDIFKRIIEKHCKNNEKPLFLFINFLETHEMYCPPLRWRKFSRPLDKQKMSMFKFYRLRENYQIRSLLDRYCKLYDDEIYYLDNQIRIMWDMWKKSPLAENTIFIITSDHGEHLGEKGLYQHRLSLYNELIWVPLLISLPPCWI
jgi:arylsulfatase A-like enzyme